MEAVAEEVNGERSCERRGELDVSNGSAVTREGGGAATGDRKATDDGATATTATVAPTASAEKAEVVATATSAVVGGGGGTTTTAASKVASLVARLESKTSTPRGALVVVPGGTLAPQSSGGGGGAALASSPLAGGTKDLEELLQRVRGGPLFGKGFSKSSKLLAVPLKLRRERRALLEDTSKEVERVLAARKQEEEGATSGAPASGGAAGTGSAPSISSPLRAVPPSPRGGGVVGFSPRGGVFTPRGGFAPPRYDELNRRLSESEEQVDRWLAREGKDDRIGWCTSNATGRESSGKKKSVAGEAVITIPHPRVCVSLGAAGFIQDALKSLWASEEAYPFDRARCGDRALVEQLRSRFRDFFGSFHGERYEESCARTKKVYSTSTKCDP